MDKPECDLWFVSQVLPLEGTLTGYLRRAWRASHEVEDLRQEIYVRVYNAALSARPASVRAFVFSTARNLLIDRARRLRVVSFEQLHDLEFEAFPVDRDRLERQLDARSKLRHLEASLETLPLRCRQVFWLRKIEGLSQRDVARRMLTTESTVEKQLAKAVRLLADSLYGANNPEVSDEFKVSLVRRDFSQGRQ